MTPSFPTITLFASLLLSSYLTARCFTPPNPNPAASSLWKRDRVAALGQHEPGRLVLRRVVAVGLAVYHAVLAVTNSQSHSHSNSSSYLCRNPSNLNPMLFTWSPYTITCLFLIICLGAPIRLAAYSALGRNFTFRLAQPDHLVTTGVYRYVQHPSYTGQMLVLLGNLALFARWDAALGCWVPEGGLERVRGTGWVVYVVIGVVIAWLGWIRVCDEEDMLRERFGESWERWRRRTKRFVPGVF